MLRIAAFLALAFAAPAKGSEAHYAVYAAGFNVMDAGAQFEVGPSRYQVRMSYRTVGAFGFLYNSHSDSTADGQFAGDRAVPRRMFSSGVAKGDPRVTQIDYARGDPVVVQLVPSVMEDEHAPVPAAAQAGSIDPLSAMAALIRLVTTTGRCDERVTTFDGRRLGVMQVRTAGRQELPATSRSSFSGLALRCEFTGWQTGGFKLDADPEEAREPHTGTAWFAAAAPGGPQIPVRVEFKTKWLGSATMYLVDKPAQ